MCVSECMYVYHLHADTSGGQERARRTHFQTGMDWGDVGIEESIYMEANCLEQQKAVVSLQEPRLHQGRLQHFLGQKRKFRGRNFICKCVHCSPRTEYCWWIILSHVDRLLGVSWLLNWPQTFLFLCWLSWQACVFISIWVQPGVACLCLFSLVH